MRIQRNDGSGAGDTSRRVYHAKPQMQPEAPAPQSRPEEEADEYDAEDDGDERPRRRVPVGLVIVLVFAVLGILGLLAGDLLMALVDPRISFTKKEGAR